MERSRRKRRTATSRDLSEVSLLRPDSESEPASSMWCEREGIWIGEGGNGEDRSMMGRCNSNIKDVSESKSDMEERNVVDGDVAGAAKPRGLGSRSDKGAGGLGCEYVKRCEKLKLEARLSSRDFTSSSGGVGPFGSCAEASNVPCRCSVSLAGDILCSCRLETCE
jgi:hypothetical protein